MADAGKQMRFTDSELAIIRGLFKDNPEALKLMRKVFLPELDPKAPLGQMVDLWMTVPVKELSAEQAVIRIMARNELIMHVEQMLMQLDALAGMKEETAEERKARIKKDSAK